MDYIVIAIQLISINIVALYCLIKSVLVIIGKDVPRCVKDKLTREVLRDWCKIRSFAYMMEGVGFYCIAFSRNLSIMLDTKLILGLIGVFLISSGIILRIRNNIKKIERWSSSI